MRKSHIFVTSFLAAIVSATGANAFSGSGTADLAGAVRSDSAIVKVNGWHCERRRGMTWKGVRMHSHKKACDEQARYRRSYETASPRVRRRTVYDYETVRDPYDGYGDSYGNGYTSSGSYGNDSGYDSGYDYGYDNGYEYVPRRHRRRVTVYEEYAPNYDTYDTYGNYYEAPAARPYRKHRRMHRRRKMHRARPSYPAVVSPPPISRNYTAQVPDQAEIARRQQERSDNAR